VKHIVSFSGGKDSTAMLLRMIELNYQIDEVIFADTTFEFPEMYMWINKIESILPFKITKVTAPHSFDSWFYGIPKRGKRGKQGIIRGFPPEFYGCWWQRDCKTNAISKKIGKGNIVYMGIASDEFKRSKAKRYSKGDNTYKFPLIDWNWSESDCVKYLESKGLKHPLVTKFKRTGCWLCPKQSKKSLYSLYIHYPILWERLKKYELDSPNGFKAKIKLDDLELEFKNNEVKSECDANDDGIPPNNKLLGILPNEL
jgi:3'-phosphoadenosine 5'-phosphosulfate sulfotransferase (PAPS reductase)/FAD synthetase